MRFRYHADILRVFFRTVNEKLGVGRTVEEITPAFVQSLAVSLGEMAILMSSALWRCLTPPRSPMEADVCLSGQMNLLFCPEFEGSGARRVIDFLSREEELTRLVLQRAAHGCSSAGKSGAPSFRIPVWWPAGTPSAAGDAGAIAVIGPTRMDYGKMVTSIEYLADTVGRMLTELLDQQG